MPDTRAQIDAEKLYRALLRALIALGGTGGALYCSGRYQGTGHCQADSSAPREHNVLVVVEDSRVDVDARIPAAFRRFPSHIIMPVSEQGRRQVPSAAIQHHVMREYAKNEIGALAPEVLVNARIGTDAFRLFISYRHEDCAAAAAQIFHQLAEAQFAVFLDRFSGLPGQNFVARINSELFDKACLLVLETPDVGQSHWVQTEVQTARVHHLGLLAVDLPGSKRTLPIRHRHSCIAANGGQPLGRHGRLDEKEVMAVVHFVRQHMAEQGARRRRWQRRSLREATAKVGFTNNQETSRGRRVSHANHDYDLTLTARPPDAAMFKHAADAHTPAERPVLFGPLSHQLDDDAALTAWLDDVSGVRAFDEGTMIPTLHLIKGGQV